MVEDEIVEVGIDQDGKLYVRPTDQSFPYIYRAAMEIGWDPVRGALFSPKPREWSHLDWFRQILVVAADEYGVRLRIGAATVWSNVPELLRMQIETDQARVQAMTTPLSLSLTTAADNPPSSIPTPPQRRP